MTESSEGAETPTPDITPAVFHVLLALADGAMHGYAIMQAVEESTDGEVRLPPGTLYRSIKKMLESGLIEETDGPAEVEEDDERRRYYAITPEGRRVATREARRLAGLVGLARAKRFLEGTDTA